MRIIAAGASHATAPFALLERLTVPPAELETALAQLTLIASEALILSTCNRTEIYAVLPPDVPETQLLQWLAARTGEDVATLQASGYVHLDEDAVRHALRVASGLDSMALGEDQIQSQFKRALHAARAAEALGPNLERLGAAALSCGKQVRAFTGLGRHALSLESIAVESALSARPAAGGSSVVVIGSGNSASIVMRHLRDHDVRDVAVVARSAGRAGALAEAGTRVVEWDLLPELLVGADILFCCTSAPHPVLTPDLLLRRRIVHPGRPLLCVDLGMPRDVDPAVSDIDGMSVVSLDALGREAAARRESREHHVPAAEAIVDREVGRFFDWLDARDSTTEIVQIRAHADAVAETELRRALARMHGLPARERAIIAELARRIARKLAHRHTDAIKRPEIALMAEQA
ncbi:MAG: glutamyl-tRNA reductase [Gemmatimonadaceae bacterium]